jgi:hypothetical protein
MGVTRNAAGRRIGESHHRSKYLDSDISEARSMAAAGFGYGSVAKILGMPKSTVASIVTGRRRPQTVEK